MRGRSRGWSKNKKNKVRGGRWQGLRPRHRELGFSFPFPGWFPGSLLGSLLGMGAGLLLPLGEAAAQTGIPGPPSVGAPGTGAIGAFGGGGIATGIGAAGTGSFAPAPGAITTPFAGFGAAPLPATAPLSPALAPLDIPEVPPAWLLTPSLELGEAFNDNVNLAPRGSRVWDFITTITPSLALTGQTGRLTTAITYDPQELLFARSSPSNVLQQRLLGTARAELWRQTFFVEGEASIGQAFVRNTGAIAPTTLTTSNNLQTVYSESVSPYLLQHLGSYADSETRYRFSDTSTSGAVVAPEQTHELRETLIGGEFFGRLGWQILGDATRLDRGQLASDPFSGVTSKDELLRADLKYPIYQALSAVGGVGYERISDPTLSDQPHGVIWDVGLNYQPNPLVSATLTYGQRFGRNDIEFNGTYNLDPQLRVSAIYTQTLQTSQSQIAGNTANITIDPLTGRPVTNPQLVPISPTIGGGTAASSSTFGVTTGSFIAKTGQIDAVLTKERNTYELRLYESKIAGNQTIAGATPTPSTVTAERIFGGIGSWSHLLREDLSSSASAGWYRTLFLDGSGRRDNVYTPSP
jgi:uncharacterized protein (PEP-CTERM system associated)